METGMVIIWMVFPVVAIIWMGLSAVRLVKEIFDNRSKFAAMKRAYTKGFDKGFMFAITKAKEIVDNQITEVKEHYELGRKENTEV